MYFGNGLIANFLSNIFLSIHVFRLINCFEEQRVFRLNIKKEDFFVV